jgi:hypothetical protein
LCAPPSDADEAFYVPPRILLSIATLSSPLAFTAVHRRLIREKSEQRDVIALTPVRKPAHAVLETITRHSHNA